MVMSWYWMNTEISSFLWRFVVLKVFQFLLGSLFLLLKYYCIPRHTKGREFQPLNIFMLNKSLFLSPYVWSFEQLYVHHHKNTKRLKKDFCGEGLNQMGKKFKNCDIKLFTDLGVVNCPVTHQSNFSCLLMISTT